MGRSLQEGEVEVIHVAGLLKFGKRILCPALNRFDQRYIFCQEFKSFELV